MYTQTKTSEVPVCSGRKRQFDRTDCVNTSTKVVPIDPNNGNRAPGVNSSIPPDASHYSATGSSTSILVQSLKGSPCQRSMWYLHRMIVVVTLWIMCCCSSEAFASRSNNSFFGRKLGTAGYFRGGSSSTSGTTTTTKSVSDTSTSTLTCVMQAPPRITSTINGGFNNDDSNYNEKKQKNGVEQSSSVIPNGAAFYRSQRKIDRMDDTTMNDKKGTKASIAVQDVITAAVHVAETKLPTDIGQFQLRAYRIPDRNGNNQEGATPMAQQEPCVIYSRDKPPFGNATHLAQHVPVRIHDQCLTSEVFGSQRYDTMIFSSKSGIFLSIFYTLPHNFKHVCMLGVTVRSSYIWHCNT